MTARLLVILAAVAGFTGVALGAFGAHALKNRLTEDLLAVWQTAVQYHLVHALALLACGVLARQGLQSSALQWAAVGFVTGIILFSGSLYLLALSGQKWLGMITPLGGLAFLVGWLALVWLGMKQF